MPAPATQTKPRVLAKLSRPRPGGMHPRARLFCKLDAARARRATWIAGPPGAGKTTLAASYLDSRGLACLWYQVDDGDEDVATFFHYLGLAAQAGSRKRIALPRYTPAYAKGIAAFSRNFFAELFERLPRPAVIVLDNYQKVSTEALLHEVMRCALEAIPDGCHVIFLTRHAPGATLARFQANGEMSLIAWSDLQLTEEEAEGIVALRSRPLPALGAPWAARTQGWAAGLVLLLEWLEREGVDPAGLASFVPETVFDYFAGELLQKVEPEIRAVLLKAAILPRMEPRSVAALAGVERAGRILAELNRRNFFVTRQAGAQEVYQFYALFRQFLLKQAKDALPAEELGWLEVCRRRAAGAAGRDRSRGRAVDRGKGVAARRRAHQDERPSAAAGPGNDARRVDPGASP
jgi:LuxR family transcriptional regulator, maltose regulon positive regulatory protein